MEILSDPTKLKPLIKKEDLLQVVIETPAGSRNEFAFDPDQGIFALRKCAITWAMVKPVPLAAWAIAPDDRCERPPVQPRTCL